MQQTGSAGQPVLYGIGGPAKGRKILLGHHVVTVGRRSGMAVTIADPKLSGHHADLVYADGVCILRDRMSTNGTFVNGELAAEARLAENDRIRMGRSEFVFTTLEKLDAAEMMLALRESAELVNDSATSVIGAPKVQMSLAAQSVKVTKVCGTEELATAHKLCSLYEIARRINVLSELDSLLDLVVSAILDEMGADRAVLLLPDRASGRLEPVVAKCRDGVATEGPVQVSETIVRQAVETGQSILTEDAGTDERFREGDSVTLAGIRSAMCVPLLANDKVVGVAYVDKVSCTGAFAAGDLEFLTVLCNSAAISIENARLFSEVQARNREVMEAHRRLEASYRRLEETQQKLIQAEKMSSLGRLVAGIAHDLKNILTSVTGYAQLLKAPVPDEKRTTYVERLNETSTMCARMVRDLLSFAHQDEVVPEPVRLEPLIADALDVVRTPAEEAGVEIVCDFDPELPAVQLDALQMMRVLTNMLTNALQAMEDTDGPRRLTLRTRREPHATEEGVETALIVIEDTGPGIPGDIMGKIFDPFFTTKPSGKGTGLGLSLCQGIVGAPRGQISVESSPGQGARFALRMPIAGPLGERNTPVETG
jgi:signal transduction histidine kinase